MQALILAAGCGKRLDNQNLGQPKCLIKIAGKYFIERMVLQLHSRNITDITIVVGFQKDKIKNFLLSRFPQFSFKFCYNEKYDSTNNAYSLYLAKDLIDDILLLLDSDIIFDSKILDLMLKSDKEIALALRKASDLGQEEMKMQINLDDNKIIKISKNINIKDSIGESIGIAKFSKKAIKKLFNQLKINIVDLNEINAFYEKTFQDLINIGEKFYAIDVANLACAEVDFIEDIDYVKAKIIPKINLTKI